MPPALVAKSNKKWGTCHAEESAKEWSVFMWFFRKKKKSGQEMKPEAEKTPQLKPEESVKQMLADAGACMQAKQYAKAADTYRAVLTLEPSAEAMNWLGVLYNAGAGVVKNDLAALYWLDKAAEAGHEAAKKDRDGILRAYVKKYGRSKIKTVTQEISRDCEIGALHIPKDQEKAIYWREKGERIAASRPKLSEYIIFGAYNGHNPEVILQDKELSYSRVLVDKTGVILNFPGIEKGSWTKYIEGSFRFEKGIVEFRTTFEIKKEGGFQMLWQIQPDGRYWADSDGFGMENDTELILYADLNDMGDFTGPFRIYKIDGKRVDERQKEKPAISGEK